MKRKPYSHFKQHGSHSKKQIQLNKNDENTSITDPLIFIPYILMFLNKLI